MWFTLTGAVPALLYGYKDSRWGEGLRGAGANPEFEMQHEANLKVEDKLSQSTKIAKTKVLICYPYFAHYRLPIIRELASSDELDVYYTSDVKTNVRGLELISPTAIVNGRSFASMHNSIRNHWIFDRFLWQSGLVRQVAFGNYDVLVILANLYYLSSMVSVIIARVRGKRVLMWGHGFIRAKKTLLERLRALFYRSGSGHMLYGHRAASIMASHGIPRDRTYVIYNSLDFEVQESVFKDLVRSGEFDQRMSEGVGAIKLFFIGRLTEHKRLDILIDAVDELVRRGRPVTCKLIGDGSIREALRKRVDALGIESQVIFTGAVYDEKLLAREIVGSDLCVIPGKVGLTCMHSMAYGVPVITHDNLEGQNPEVEAIIEGKSGTYFREGDHVDLALQIERWWDRGVTRRENAEECRRVILERYNPKVQSELIRRAVQGL